MKVSEKKQGIQDSIAYMKSRPITKSQTKMTMNYDNVGFMKLAALCTSSICPQAAPHPWTWLLNANSTYIVVYSLSIPYGLGDAKASSIY